jgi:hypothetical protein
MKLAMGACATVAAGSLLFASACSDHDQSSGTSSICGALSQSPELKELDQALVDLADSATAPKAQEHIKSAANKLRNIGSTAGDSLRPKFTAAADALDRLATVGITDESATDASSQALTTLGSEVDSTCHFPLG